MAGTAALLIELGTEELPPKALDDLAVAFSEAIRQGLVGRNIDISGPDDPTLQRGYQLGPRQTYCSPRRIAAYFPFVAIRQNDYQETAWGPPVKASHDFNGVPTKALVGFMAKQGVAESDLVRLRKVDNSEYFGVRRTRIGRPTAELIQDILDEALKALPIPKPMRWGAHAYGFVRPAHWLVVLHGSDVVDASVLGLRSGRQSRGHRFHHPQPVHVADADSWLDALRAAKVLADPAERRARIRAEVARVGRDTGGEPRLSDGLLDEIANLTEWPVAIGCTFERAFLEVPAEALVTTMETNQKFVPVFGADARLTEHFIGIANIESKDPAEIRKGYERVIRPRFADAKFFFDEDRKQPLEAYQRALESVTYQQQLGSVWDKVVRVAELARVIANRCGVDAGLATRAAALAKCDLMTRMVGEFPELQGVMGRYYATAGGEDAAVAAALDEVYAPRYAGDAIAAGPVGRVLAIAERLDTLAGIFAVGLKPSGNKDPFALRRAALGLARTLIEGGLDLDLQAQIAEALAQLPETAFAGKDGKSAVDAGTRRDELAAELYEFILDRLRGYYADQGIGSEAFEAVRVLAPSSLLDFDRRLRAVVAFAGLPEAEALAAANKRIGNILRQAGGEANGDIERALLAGDAETGLVDALAGAERDAAPLIGERDYVGLLRRLAALRGAVDRYFDEVMVMADDPAVRRNRLAVLGRLRALFLRVADVALLQRG
ncbi:MAG TPA: glycine--tRNA ligase subunit beta [Dokdonella sp.]|uniref:glycine--tRNA ligase subunit beta n=1 Tax=Dokdonella sp. TaxID=2291710 RepID=UPI002B6EDF04|nr:glycine--tRNA ligase subunit beta [Dokdonella sp.]HUD42898.1 glycine--tRNA ligase subunit beta [Dokdonella sp.]